eukprot:gene7379-373_t
MRYWELIENEELIQRLLTLCKQCVNGVDRNGREGRLRLKEMDKIRGKHILVSQNKKKRSDRRNDMVFVTAPKALKKMNRKELVDQATLRGAKCHQLDGKPTSYDSVLKTKSSCGFHMDLMVIQRESPMCHRMGSAVSSQACDDGSGAESDEPKRKYRKRK